MHKGIKIIIGAAASYVLVAALYVFYTFDPEVQSIFPKCPFLLITGFECPGCGSQRAIHSLLHLDFGAAFHYNAILLPAIMYIFLGIYLTCFDGKKRNPQLENIFYGKWSAIVVLSVILAYWILRNIC